MEEEEKNSIILSEIKKFSTFTNPNSFDEYYLEVLPKSNYKSFDNLGNYNYNYIYVSKSSILNKPKKSHGLHHKNHTITKKIIPLSKTTKKSFLHKKRQGDTTKKQSKFESINRAIIDNDVEMSDVSVPKTNNNDELRKCMICSWEFPDDMTVKEKNTHVNYCVDGRGEEHKKHYEEGKIVEKINSMPIKEEDYEACPICSKLFKTKNVKIKMNHIADCLKEFQEKDLYMSKKKREQVYKSLKI